MEPLSQGLVVYGPLGLWALAATMGVVGLYKENRSLRDAHQAKLEAIGKERSAEANATALAVAGKLEAIGTAHATALRDRDVAARERDERVDRQQAELAQRILGVVTTVTEKLAAFSDAITRRSPR